MGRAEPEDWQADLAPREQPLTYPGAWPETSILLAGAQSFRLQPQRGRRLGQWRVLDCEHLPGELGLPEPQLPLNEVLIRYNVARVDERTPVLAVGSNAAPAQLRHKYRDTGVSLVMPLVQVRAEGLAAGVAADVAPAGYVPGTPVLGPGLEDELFVQWLDAHQLALLDATEPGYTRLLLPAGDPATGGVRLTLPSGEVLGACDAYVCDRGCLIDPSAGGVLSAAGRQTTEVDGAPLALLPRAGAPLPGGGRRRGLDRQTALVSALLDRSPRLRQVMGDSTEWFVRAHRPGVGDEVRRIFGDEGWVRHQAPAVDRPPQPDVPVPRRRYGTILPATPPAPGTWRVVPSADDIQRQGEAVVRVSPSTSRTLGDPDHVTVRHAAATADSEIENLDALARVLVDETATRDDVVELDEILRIAVGAEIGEDVTLHPVRVRHRRWLNHLIGRPFYVSCRVQPADPATAERAVCLLDPLTLDLMGIQSGAEVVVEGRADDGGEVRQIRLKAVAASDAVRQRREAVTGGDFGARFPSARDALGVVYDIPWMYLDSSGRSLLGLGRQRLATVRVRPSRSFQLRQELREMLLVLGLAFIGLIELVHQTWARVGLLAAMVGLVVVTISVRMRGRLTRRLIRPRHQRRKSRN